MKLTTFTDYSLRVLIYVAAAPSGRATIAEIARVVDAAKMKATVEKLVSFGTRHTLSSQTDPNRGIGAAVRWAEAEMKKMGLETLQTCDTVTKLPRIPTPTKICNAVAIQRGTERPNDIVIITGHIDSRVSDPMNATADAPGANDDGSGTAAVLEAARLLSKHKFPGTIVYAALSGEEQGLNGGKIMADYAKAQGWKPRARIVCVANMGDDPTLMLNAPVNAAKKVLKNAGLTLADIDLFEVNEAFAVVAERFIRHLNLDRDKVNVNGGAMALGHPIGATGAMLIGTALDELERRGQQRALITMCTGGGMGTATIIERI